MFRGFLCVIRNCLLIVLGFRQSVHAVFMFNVDLSFFFKILAFLSSFVFMIKLRGRLQRFPNTSYADTCIDSPLTTSVPSVYFCCEPKTAIKNKIYV